MKCKDCHYWDQFISRGERQERGYCRRMPPHSQDWAVVSENDWCGEFKKKVDREQGKAKVDNT